MLFCFLFLVSGFFFFLSSFFFCSIFYQGYNVGDLGLVIQSIPNDETKARDMGGWSACQNLGMSIGSMYAAAVISFFHEAESFSPSPSSSNSSSPGGGAHEARVPYTRTGYQMVFLPAAAFMFCSVSLVFLARKRLAGYEWNNKGMLSTTEDSTSTSGVVVAEKIIALPNVDAEEEDSV